MWHYLASLLNFREKDFRKLKIKSVESLLSNFNLLVCRRISAMSWVVLLAEKKKKEKKKNQDPA